MRKTRWVLGFLGAALSACGFDSTGSGDGTESQDGTGGSETSAGPAGVTITTMSSATSTTATTTTATTDDGSTTTVDGSTGGDTSADGPGSEASTGGSSTDPSAGSSSDGESSGGDACADPPPFAEIYPSADATVVDPMTLTMSMALPGMPMVAYSPSAEMGTITYDFAVDCADTYYAWGLVFDNQDGATDNGFNNGADSFYFAVDGDASPEGDAWIYGCETDGNDDGTWSWQRVELYIEPSCMVQDWSIDLAAGNHSFQLLNREGSDGGNDIAAIHSVVISNDVAFDPSTLFMP